MSQLINEETKGIFAIAPTPFSESGSIDNESVDRLIQYYLRVGVHGITILGVMGEAHKLSVSEQKAFAKYVLEKVAGRVPIIVGVSNPGIDNLVELANDVMEIGASGIMIAAIPGLKTDEQIFAYFSTALKRLDPDIPVCVQDYPAATTVYLSVPVINRIFTHFNSVKMYKHEDWPGLWKLSALRKTSQEKEVRRVSILVGNGALFVPQEMLRGADGVMSGFSFPEMLVAAYGHFAGGRPEEAEDVYDLYLPLVKHEHQPGVGLAVRKEVFRLRSILKTAKCRDPAPAFDNIDRAELLRMIGRLKRKLVKAEMELPEGL
jgi:4-hydroxy-tetrahydrodipicolinate synthase